MTILLGSFLFEYIYYHASLTSNFLFSLFFQISEQNCCLFSGWPKTFPQGSKYLGSLIWARWERPFVQEQGSNISGLFLKCMCYLQAYRPTFWQNQSMNAVYFIHFTYKINRYLFYMLNFWIQLSNTYRWYIIHHLVVIHIIAFISPQFQFSTFLKWIYIIQ